MRDLCSEARADAKVFRAVDGVLHRDDRNVTPGSFVAIEQNRCGAFAQNFDLRICTSATFTDAAHQTRQHSNAVRRDAEQIGFRHNLGFDVADCRRHADRRKCVADD